MRLKKKISRSLLYACVLRGGPIIAGGIFICTNDFIPLCVRMLTFWLLRKTTLWTPKSHKSPAVRVYTHYCIRIFYYTYRLNINRMVRLSAIFVLWLENIVCNTYRVYFYLYYYVIFVALHVGWYNKTHYYIIVLVLLRHIAYLL